MMVINIQMAELELTDEMEERNDEIYNAVQECICTLTEEELDWDMEIIGEVTDCIKDSLSRFGKRVRYPGIITDQYGIQHYED